MDAVPDPSVGHLVKPSTGGLWDPERRALTVGLVLTITFIAAEALAVVTVMPRIARDLGGVHLYGWAFSAFMLGSLIGIVAAGRAADRAGPARPYVAGLTLFAVGLLVSGLAPSMGVLVAGRTLQGVGAGAVPAVAYVVIGRSLPEHLRARMMAVLSTAWVVPGMVGPLVAAEVARTVGWRWVFLGLLPLVAAAGLIALPALVRLGPPGTAPVAEHRLLDAVRTAVGAAFLLAGLGGHGAGVAAALGLSGLAIGLPALRRLLPAGTLRGRRGLPATVATRGLLTFAFFGGDAFVTLGIMAVLHASTTMASLAVTGSTLAWTAGSWLQARLHGRCSGRLLVRLGLLVIIAGLCGFALALRHTTPVWAAVAAWSLAGLGMGLAYAPTTLIMLHESPPGREGWASASISLADVLGTALGAGLGGAAVAAGSSHGALPTGVTAAFVVAAVGGLVALALTWRIPSGRPAATGV